MFKVNNKNTRTMSLMSTFEHIYIFHKCSSVSVVDFEQEMRTGTAVTILVFG